MSAVSSRVFLFGCPTPVVDAAPKDGRVVLEAVYAFAAGRLIDDSFPSTVVIGDGWERDERLEAAALLSRVGHRVILFHAGGAVPPGVVPILPHAFTPGAVWVAVDGPHAVPRPVAVRPRSARAVVRR